MIRLLLGLVLGMGVYLDAHAGYAQVAPPVGWTSSTAVENVGRHFMQPPANTPIGNGWRGVSGVINVGGRAITMPTAYTVAANAPRYIARTLLGPAGIAIAAVSWAASECVEYAGGQFKLTCGGTATPEHGGSITTGGPYGATQISQCQASYGATSVCQQIGTYCAAGRTAAQCNAIFGNSHNVAGPSTSWQVRCVSGPACTNPVPAPGRYNSHATAVAGAVGSGPTPQNPQSITQQQAEDKLAAAVPANIPDEVWRALPEGVPVELPILNPLPSGVPYARPLLVPEGSPVPVPNSDPQVWRQPVTEIVPAPSPDAPWRVELTPRDVISTTPGGLSGPTTPTNENLQPGDPNEGTPSDTALPDQPKLYTPKYPNGIIGVWNTKIAAIKQTPLFTAPAALIPTLNGNGNCPGISIPLQSFWNFAGANLDFSPPCYVWDFCRFIIILSSLLLARGLVFGG